MSLMIIYNYNNGYYDYTITIDHLTLIKDTLLKFNLILVM
jgi:hypothetical protein